MLAILLILSLLGSLSFANAQESSSGGDGGSGLKHKFYALSCPQAEDIARRTLQRNRMSDPTAPAALLRVVFHDCQVEGCDASILLETSSAMTAETVSEKNFSIRRLDYIHDIKAAIEKECPGIVSCADIIVMAARDAIAMSGGPQISIETGRRDTLFASNLNADEALPPPTLTVSEMLDTLAEKGLDIEESVAILGAHTLGVGHCLNFINRFDPQDNGPQMSPFFSTALRVLCQSPPSMSNATFAPNDLTNFMFDNQYFRDLQGQRGLLTVDAELAIDPRTKKHVDLFALNQLLFFAKFSDGFVKLTSFNVLTGSDGEIRRDCRAVNREP
ncbi:hypothetical protein SELMODRAFT_137067 [Selaginella moellendorffii]|uniref:Peroxidase n=1 Tax=Selaginella moellendorffii TaxID=88036 RepID=D8TCU7_SELML|nr:peroxidase 29 [Selaginella moellendorffii]EFJ05505.1 hypothetical protein SELMODRAFT_137067 [Selaginella moellendorffii]|eukprot:XP_002993412.1 peroxidase 29 [Selaginella moellendorffii]